MLERGNSYSYRSSRRYVPTTALQPASSTDINLILHRNLVRILIFSLVKHLMIRTFRTLSRKNISTIMTTTMKAAVIYQAGGPEVFKIEQLPIPTPNPGQVLIQVKAFGLNRSELFTRQGHSPGVKFPRVLGIEATGIVASCPGNEFSKGDVVVSAMGGMGRDFDGGYAEYTCVSATNVQVIKTELPWEVLGAMPEMLQTSWGALFKALRLCQGERLLIRGGTSSIGLAAAAIARNRGAFVVSTSRRADREAFLKESGANEVLVDDGTVAGKIGEKFDRVLELIGTTTLKDSLMCVKEGGSVCMAGIVGNKWTFDEFSPMEAIPMAVNLTTYSGGPDEFMATPLEELAKQVKEGKLKIQVGKVFKLDEIVEAHRVMEENSAGGKIVVLT
ncbi:putative zinc-binding oxidoreductase [Rhexocercosporidium sp. MPI-PUGE-AT-0058]|nr:putative zinc-binding oxidoreductase [Rhexocercosporidium sp. MPI-PUGE-AT-0058]